MLNAAAAILAGGSARRFGHQLKSHLIVDGERIIDRQLRVLRRVVADVCICANDPQPFADLGLPILADEAGEGPLAGIASALAWSPAERVFVLGCDMPFPDQRVIELLLATPGAVVAPLVQNRLEPLFAVYERASCAPAISARLRSGRYKAAELLVELAVPVPEPRLREFDPELKFLVNVNTPSDLKKLAPPVSS